MQQAKILTTRLTALSPKGPDGRAPAMFGVDRRPMMGGNFTRLARSQQPCNRCKDGSKNL
jgi:hypothetical protein